MSTRVRTYVTLALVSLLAWLPAPAAEEDGGASRAAAEAARHGGGAFWSRPVRPRPRTMRVHSAASTLARSAVFGRQVSAAAPATTALATSRGPVEVIPDEVLVQLRRGVGAAAVRSIAAATGTTVRSHAAGLSAARLSFDPGRVSLGETVQRLARHPLVRHAGPHAIVRATDETVVIPRPDGDYTLARDDDNRLEVFGPDGALAMPALYGLQWNLNVLRLGKVVKHQASGAGITIAILDTGVAYEDHADELGFYALAPDLAHVDFVKPRDVVHGDDHANDDNGHGTQMTTLICGFGATVPIAGNVKIMPVKVLDADRIGTELGLIEGIDWAVAQGADVINLSLAFSEGYQPSPLLTAVIASATESGVVLVAATGNEGGEYTAYPAAFDDVIGVGAVRPLKPDEFSKEDSAPTEYGNARASMDVLMPGGSHAWDLDENGLPDALVSMTFAPGAPLDFGYWLTSGTSAAAAQASGVAASLLELGDHPEDIRLRFVKYALTQSGEADFSHEAGSGRVDAGKSVEEATKDSMKQECRDARAYVNATATIIAPTPDTRQAVFYIETLTEELEEKKWRLHGRIRGATDELFSVETDGDGLGLITSQPVPWDAAAGVAWSLDLEAAWRDVGGCGKIPVRPRAFTRIDELSFRLAFDLSAGLTSTGLVLVVDPSAVAPLVELLDKEVLEDFVMSQYVETYLHRPIGTGMAESSLVAVFDETHLASNDLLERSLILRTFGTGMAESSFLLDEGFFHPALLPDYGLRDLLVRGELSGTGMAESSIVLEDGSTLAWDHYFGDFEEDRRILWLAYGAGEGSAALVFDGSLLNPALFESDTAGIDADMASTQPLVGGAGMAESSRVVDFSEAHVAHFGYDYQALESWFLTGTGMAESSLILDGPLWTDFGGPLMSWLGGMGMAESSLVASWSPLHLWTLGSTLEGWSPASMSSETTAGTGIGLTPVQ